METCIGSVKRGNGIGLDKQTDKEMNSKEKAEEVVDKFKDYVHGYVGSSMLSNYEYPDQILSQAKKVAHITVDEVIAQWENIDTYLADGGGELNPNLRYWQEVKQELDKL